MKIMQEIKTNVRIIRDRSPSTASLSIQNAMGFLVGFIATLAIAFPFYWLLKVAFTWPPEGLYGQTPSLIFESFELYNFVRVIFEVDFLQYFKNSVIITAISVIGTVIINSLAGYALRLEFTGKRIVMAFIIAALFVPTFVTIIPLYIISDELGLLNTHLGVALPFMAGIIGTLIFKNSFEAVPDATLESARLDGASELYILFGILWPISKPAIAVNIILTFISAWNSYLWPLIILTDRELFPLPLALAQFTNQLLQGHTAISYAFALLVLLPSVIVFLLLQNQFMSSVVEGSLKR